MNITTLIIFFLSNFLVGEGEPSLSIQIDNIQSSSGIIWVGIYDSPESFLDKDQAILKRIDVNQTGEISLRISDLTYGKDYAIAVLHDLNSNGYLDRNYFGIPTEPFAFSGHIQSNWRAPKFEEVKFSFNTPHQSLHLTLKKWWDF